MLTLQSCLHFKVKEKKKYILIPEEWSESLWTGIMEDFKEDREAGLSFWASFPTTGPLPHGLEEIFSHLSKGTSQLPPNPGCKGMQRATDLCGGTATEWEYIRITQNPPVRATDRLCHLLIAWVIVYFQEGQTETYFPSHMKFF